MNMTHPTHRSERGAVLIMVVVAMVALLAFGAFVIDYGIMWTGRGQVQTSADAGALAGSISLAFDSPTDFAGAKTKASWTARANNVWGTAPDVQLTDVTFPPCPAGAPGLANTCVKVDAFRNQTRGNPLPTFLGNLVGITDQGVRATATAQIVTGNKTDCLKPWAVIDRWEEFGEPFSALSTFDKYSDGKGQAPPQEADNLHPAERRFRGHRVHAARGSGAAVRREDRGGRRLLGLVPGDRASARRRRLDRRQRLPGQHHDVRRFAVRDRRAGHCLSGRHRSGRRRLLGDAGVLRREDRRNGRSDAAGHRVSHRLKTPVRRMAAPASSGARSTRRPRALAWSRSA